jgi:hypothetical protein
MNGYKVLLLAMAIILISAATEAGAIYVVAHPALIAPGETGVPLTLTIINNGEMPLLNVTVKPLYSFPFGSYTYINKTNLTIPAIPAGSSVNVTLLININPRAVDGIYIMRIKLYYAILNPAFQEFIQATRNLTRLINVTKIPRQFLNLNSTVNVTIPILGYVNMGADTPFWGSSSTPIQAEPGIGVVPLMIPLLNTGNVVASNVSAYLEVGNGLVPISSKAVIGYMPPGTPITVPFLINITSKAPIGNINGTLIIRYFNNSTQDLSISIPITGKPTLVAQSAVWGSPQSPISVGPGYGVVPLLIPILDTGSTPVTNVSASIELPQGLSPLYDTAVVGSLAPGIPNYAVFMVNISNVEPGTYYATLSLKYRGGSSSQRVPIIISGSPNVIIQSYYTNPPNVFSGYPAAQLVIYVTNAGTSIARNVKVMIKGDDYVKIVSPSSGVINVGTLPLGTPVPLNFVISTGDNLYREVRANLTLVINGTGFSNSYVIPLVIKPKALLTVTNVTGSLSVGSSDVPLYITITNMGNITAHNIEIILNGQGAIEPYVSSSNPLSALTAGRLEVGDLMPGQSIQVVFMVDAENGISPGNYVATLTMLWNQSGAFIPFVQNVPITVKIQPSLTQSAASLLVPKSTASIMFYIVLVLVIVLIIVAVRTRARRGV